MSSFFLKQTLHWIIFIWVVFRKSRIKIQQISGLWLVSLFDKSNVHSLVMEFNLTNLDPKNKLHNRTDASSYSSNDESSTKIHYSRYTIKQQESVWKLFCSTIFLHSFYHGYGAFFWRIRTIFFSDLSKEILQRGHSTTTWSKIYPIFPPPPLSLPKWTFYVLNSKYPPLSHEPPWTFNWPSTPVFLST